MALEPVNEGEEATSAGEVQFEDDDIVVTERKFKEMVAGNIVPKGDYVLQLTSITKTAPEAEKMGGITYRFSVVKPPDGAAMPDGGWPSIDKRIKKFYAATEKQKTSESIDEKEEAKLFKAYGVQPPFKKAELRSNTSVFIGRPVIATVKQRDVDGTIYQDVLNFRPVQG